MKRLITTLIIILILLTVGFSIWYFLIRGPYNQPSTTIDEQTNTSNGFVPINRPSTNQNTNTNSDLNNTRPNSTSTISNIPIKIPTLRLISSTPVGGYGASTTASTTVVRWVDRGRGNVYEARENTLDVITLSNTVLPRLYQSLWNKKLTAFIGSILDEDSDVSTIYAELRAPIASTTKGAVKTSTSTAPLVNNLLTPYQLKGKNLPNNIISYSVSPKKDKIFVLINEGGRGVGYVANFDGTAMTRIFDTPLVQLNSEWPEDNTIAITTKGAASQGGFLYFVNPKTGIWNKILGPIPGLSTRVSHDAKYVLVSLAGNNQNILTSIYTIAGAKSNDAVIRTLADKCIWGTFYKDLVYCAVPSQTVSANYPDDWYAGLASTIDKIWQVSAITSEVHLISSIVDQSDRVIDAFNLGLDEKDNYLFFMNKNDLTLWSIDLVKVHL